MPLLSRLSLLKKEEEKEEKEKEKEEEGRHKGNKAKRGGQDSITS
jgi:hypothetical protein